MQGPHQLVPGSLLRACCEYLDGWHSTSLWYKEQVYVLCATKAVDSAGLVSLKQHKPSGRSVSSMGFGRQGKPRQWVLRFTLFGFPEIIDSSFCDVGVLCSLSASIQPVKFNPGLLNHVKESQIYSEMSFFGKLTYNICRSPSPNTMPDWGGGGTSYN